jgi:hypothetical protein
MREMRKFFRGFRLSGGLILGICLLLASPSQGGTVHDNFNDNYLNPVYWWVNIQGTGPTVIETNSWLEITFPADSSGSALMAGISSERTLVGDFDAQVDFNLLTWPTGNGFNVSIGAGGSFTVMVSRYSYKFGDLEGYLFNHNGTMISVPATGTSGKLRLKRTGNTMEAFYWQNNAWQSMGAFADDQFSAEIPIFLNSDCGTPSRFTNELVKVAFDNFQVTNQYLGNTGNYPAPLLLLLD